MTIPKTFEESFAHVRELAAKFADNEAAYLSPKYIEQEVRDQFLNPFFESLGWDVYHREHPNPYEREVKIEKSVMVGDRGKRADYAFFTKPNFFQARFLAEAKKPARNLENQYDCFQAIRYGWNSNTPIAVLTDFEQFLVLDSRSKPNVDRALNLILEKFHYTQFADEEEFRKLYYLFSREAVAEGSLEKFVTGLKKGKKAKLDAAAPAVGTVQVEPVGDTFLNELDRERENLARAFKSGNENLDGDELTEITQRTLDRLVFIRFLEDKLVEPSEIIDRFGKKTGNAWRDFANEMPRLNSIYNGIIFKPHPILDSPTFEPDERRFRLTLNWLSHRNSSYDFNTIPIHILGSIYERFLGKTITVTEKRATVEEKPEVRKAGGVYYTPEYIVTYIVENTIGKLIAGKTPDEIAEMRFADIACGSGSFLLGMFDYLIKYHVDWYSKPKKRRDDAIKKGLARETDDGNIQLTLEQKRDILLNNIYGVDLDAQAVEVAQLSLYLKLLEEETTATAKQYLAGFEEQLLPPLGKNIVHGNSLIDYDIMDGLGFDAFEHRKLYPMNFEQTFPKVFARRSVSSPHVSKGSAGSLDNADSTGSVQPPATAGGTDLGGFDAIVGNPPYVRQETISHLKPYFQKKYETFHGVADLYVYFFERYFDLVKPGGEFGIIVANKWLRANYGQPLRGFLKKRRIEEIVDFGDLPVFQGATTYPCIIRMRKESPRESFHVTEVAGLDFDGSTLDDYVLRSRFTVNQTELEDKGWSLTDEASQLLLNKIRTRGVPLGDYVEGQVFYGIKTGLNEAFVIDAETRQRLIDEDPRSGEVIKPLVIGRDVRRYAPVIPQQYLVFTRRGVAIDQYPAIERHLRKFYIELKPKPQGWDGREAWKGRKSGAYQWFEIQDTVDYFGEFEKPKIVYPNICKKPEFTLDINSTYTNQKCFIISRDDKYLLGILNSRVSMFLFERILPRLRGNYFEPSYVFFKHFPICTINFDDPDEKAMHDQVVGLVEKMIEAKKAVADARTDKDREFYERFCEKLDRDIDDLVYRLYDITDEERKIIEGHK